MNKPLPPDFGDVKRPRVVIDGLFYQIARTGIARLWTTYLEHWAKTEFSAHLIVIDRERTAPRIEGVRYFDAPRFNGDKTGQEMLQIEKWCQELQADVFISSYYSVPIGIRSVAMVYDMIHELQSSGEDRKHWPEGEKEFAFLHANRIVAISENTAKDVRRFFPYLPESEFSVVHCGVDSIFLPASQDKITATRKKFDLTKPYFLLVGTRVGFRGYKNAAFLFRTLDRMEKAQDFEVACVGGEPTLDAFATFKNISKRLLSHVSEEDLVTLYSGAEALVYPSRYEGFGLPIIEAMACGCPVITCPNGSIPEVAGNAALFVNNDDDGALELALLKIGDPVVRRQIQSQGFERARLFTWEKAAAELAQILLETATLPEKPAREVLIWKEFREKERRLSLPRKPDKVRGRWIRLKLGKFRFHLGVSRA